MAGGALAVLLIGLPYALIRCAGPLDLTHVPGWDELAAELVGPLSVLTLLRLLAVAGWGLWLVLCGQTLYEVVWCAVRLPRFLRTGSEQHLQHARRTLTGALVVSVVLGLLTLVRPAVGEAVAAPVAVTAPANPVARAANSADVADAPSVSRRCEVRAGDTLWDLADRHLGDPLRWKEIFQLNHGRTQADGGSLTDPDVIRPGWTMVLPGVELVPPVPSADLLPRPAPPAPAPKPEPAPAPHLATPAPRPAPNPTRTTAHPGLELPAAAGYLALSVGVALSAAAVARALQRRRAYQPGEPATAPHQEPPRPEDSTLAAALRRTHRLHATASGSARPDDLPIGAHAGAEVGVLDLVARHGHRLLALTGPGAASAARAVLAAVLTHPDDYELILPTPLAQRLAPVLATRQLWPSCSRSRDTAEALDLAEARILTRAREREEDAGRPNHPLVLLLGDVEPQHSARLAALCSRGQPHGLVAVQLADLPSDDAVTLTVAADGSASFTTSPPNGQRALRLFHLTEEAAATLLPLVPESTDGEHQADTVELPAVEELAVANEERPPPPAAPSDDRIHRVRVTLLGPFTVTVDGRTVTRGLVGFAGELLAYLAVHRRPVPKETILEAIWPERTPPGATQAFNTAKTSVRTALRQALGATTSVNAILTTGELTHLNRDLITTDLDEFDRAVQAVAAAPDPMARLAAHRRVADLYTGELCADTAYEWAEPAREDLRRRALDALGALASAVAGGDPELAMSHLDRAVGIDRYNEELHLRLASVQASLGRRDGVRRTWERLTASLAEIDAKPSPPTARALQELLHPTPGPSRPGAPARPAPRPASVRTAR
ncbi:LysM peptidoglycan-binding domain-containing protein [Kitasatospora viridis]|uniref:LysM peptidoglycan-binding domain-containing protein n=1 Tax=Kitasatospora viridis TaxID=281105 RepID=UPI00147903E6|nr:LysM peptidoglycan-binding domain-containing protein [Kitasatospora viridis]